MSVVDRVESRMGAEQNSTPPGFRQACRSRNTRGNSWLGTTEPGKYLEVAPGPAAKIEYRERWLAVDVLQQRRDVLAHAGRLRPCRGLHRMDTLQELARDLNRRARQTEQRERDRVAAVSQGLRMAWR
jgi:hypothetical protein